MVNFHTHRNIKRKRKKFLLTLSISEYSLYILIIGSNDIKKDDESIGPVKVLIVYYNRYGNTSRMVEEIAYSTKEITNIRVTIRRLADDVSMDVIDESR